MRAIPIDTFLTDDHATGTSGAHGDWSTLVAEGRAARAAADGGAWRIGQLALLVERRYASGALKRFAEEIGESAGTVRRFRWVAGAYDDADRRRFHALSFSHFQAVASSPDRTAWLERALLGRWSVDRLVIESRAAGSAPSLEIRLRRPIDAARKSLTRLADQVDAEPLSSRERARLAEAVQDLATQVEALRARLERPAPVRRTRSVARAVARERAPGRPTARRTAALAR